MEIVAFSVRARAIREMQLKLFSTEGPPRYYMIMTMNITIELNSNPFTCKNVDNLKKKVNVHMYTVQFLLRYRADEIYVRVRSALFVLSRMFARRAYLISLSEYYRARRAINFFFAIKSKYVDQNSLCGRILSSSLESSPAIMAA